MNIVYADPPNTGGRGTPENQWVCRLDAVVENAPPMQWVDLTETFSLSPFSGRGSGWAHAVKRAADKHLEQWEVVTRLMDDGRHVFARWAPRGTCPACGTRRVREHSQVAS